MADDFKASTLTHTHLPSRSLLDGETWGGSEGAWIQLPSGAWVQSFRCARVYNRPGAFTSTRVEWRDRDGEVFAVTLEGVVTGHIRLVTDAGADYALVEMMTALDDALALARQHGHDWRVD